MGEFTCHNGYYAGLQSQIKQVQAITFLFRLVPLGKVTPYSSDYRLNSITAALLQGWFWH